MNKDVILLDLFSGIGGFSKGFIDAGWDIKTHYYSDIDKHANAIYKYNFKESTYVGDVRSIPKIERPNIVTLGSPCQDFSLAGKRKGLDGERSSLIGAAISLIKKYKPDIFIWENVKGVFSSNNGADFWAVIQEFTNIGGYRFEWQLLNTSWFLPQNRERIYLVGCLGKGSGSKIFPIMEGFGKDNRKRSGIIIVGDTNKGGQRGIIHSCDGNVSCLSATDYKQQKQCDMIKFGTSQDQKISPLDGNSQTLNSGHFNQPKIKIGTLRTHNDGKGFREIKSDLCPTLPARAREDGSGMPIIADFRGRNNNDKICEQEFGDNVVVSYDLKTLHGSSKTRRGGISTKRTNTLDHNGAIGIKQDKSIRRLTPVECERLQGFPDNWTKYGIFDAEIKEISDTQRYKTLGNAVTVRVVEEVARKIKDIYEKDYIASSN